MPGCRGVQVKRGDGWLEHSHDAAAVREVLHLGMAAAQTVLAKADWKAQDAILTITTPVRWPVNTGVTQCVNAGMAALAAHALHILK